MSGFAAASFFGGAPRLCLGPLSVEGNPSRNRQWVALFLACQQQRGGIPSQLDGSRHTATQALVAVQHHARSDGCDDHPAAVHLHCAAAGPGSGSGGKSNPAAGSCPQLPVV